MTNKHVQDQTEKIIHGPAYQLGKLIGIVRDWNAPLGISLQNKLRLVLIEKHKEGVEAGYRKLLEDWRDGYFVMTMTPAEVTARLADIKPIDLAEFGALDD